MAIQLAVSSLNCPTWPLEKVIEQAKTGGYAGVELAVLGPGSGVLASDPTLIDPGHIRQLLEQAGLKVVALSLPLSLAARDSAHARSLHLQAIHFLELARQLNCPLLNIKGQSIEAGQNPRQALERVAQRAVPIIKRAEELNVQLVFENGGGLPKARDWWTVLELANATAGRTSMVPAAQTLKSDGTPAKVKAGTGAAMCWNLATAAAAGEGVVVSVPMLHNRIRLAKISDFAAEAPRKPVQLGEGAAEAELFIKRLMGIGYQGFVSVEWPTALAAESATGNTDAKVNAEQFLAEARQRIQGWMDAVAKSIEDAKPKPKPARPVKPAAPAAPPVPTGAAAATASAPPATASARAATAAAPAAAVTEPPAPAPAPAPAPK